jgi:catechol 2,3-dioxygenase-like lactoylglutathione lyase family enzyme
VTTFNQKKIGEILIDRGDLNASELSFVLSLSKATGERLGKVCLENSMITEETLAQALAEQYGMEYVDLSGFKMDDVILDIFPHVIPPDAIYHYHFLPLKPSGDFLVLAVADPTDIIKLDELEFFLGRPLLFKLATESAIESVLHREEETITKQTGLDKRSTEPSCGVKIPVTSLEESLAFYRDFLGLSIKSQTEETVHFDQGLVLVPKTYTEYLPEGFLSRSLVYIQRPGIEVLYSKAKQQKIGIVTKLAPWEQSFFFRCLDPDGNVVEVFPVESAATVTRPTTSS